MDQMNCQVLSDKSINGKERPWAKFKLASQYMAIAYDEVDLSKANRMRDCAQYLGFVRKEDGSMKLHDARFCRVRLCPVCQWRRSLKTYAQMSKVLEVAERDGFQFIFVTFTVKNCLSSELSDYLTHFLRSFNLFTKYKAVQQAFKGYYRGCEVTHNINNDTFHPHLHCIFAVKPSYFSSRYYLSHEKLVELWRKALKIDYDPVVNVKKCYGGYKSVVEACKYTVKHEDVLNFDDWDMTVDTLRTLDVALSKRRFIGLGGVIKDIHKKLNLDDMEDGDLVQISDEEEESKATADEIVFFWNGYGQYEKA